MPFYQSIADILSENRQDKHAILSRTEQIISALDGLGRELSATVFLDAEFSPGTSKKAPEYRYIQPAPIWRATCP